MLVAKVHKISERHGTDRQTDKDALDVLRLLRGTETGDLADRWQKLLTDKRSEDVARSGLALLAAQFAKRGGMGVEMAIRSAGVLADPGEIAASCEALAGDLLAAIVRLGTPRRVRRDFIGGADFAQALFETGAG